MSERARFVVAAGPSAVVDRQLALPEMLRLERRDGRLHVELACRDLADATTTLARAGVAIVAPAPAPGATALRPAVVSHLEPIRRDGIVDVVTVRRTSLGEATALLARRGWSPVGRRSSRATERMRALLRGEDVLYRWGRLVLAPAAVLRSRALRGVRPIVFDRAAAGDGLDGIGFASDGALTMWLRG